LKKVIRSRIFTAVTTGNGKFLVPGFRVLPGRDGEMPPGRTNDD